MKCKKENCDSEIELLVEGGRYTRFGYFPSRSYQCPKCKTVYAEDGPQLFEVRYPEQTPEEDEGLNQSSNQKVIKMKCTVCGEEIDITKGMKVQLDTRGNEWHFHPACYRKWDDPAKDDFKVMPY